MKRGAHIKHAAVALIGVTVLAGCGTESGSGGAGSDVPVTGVRWVPESVTVDGTTYTLPPDIEAHMRFDPGKVEGDGGKSGGSGGCNGFGADVEIDGDTIHVADMVWTEMGCGEEIMRFERQFFATLDGDHRAEVSDEGTVLTLTTEDSDSITLKKS